MRTAWHDARDAYERIEGAVGMLFPHLDVAIDERYEHFVALRPDRDPFDADGITGMHGVERILWADAITPEVETFERTLQHFDPARTPGDAAEATRFREEVLRTLEEDCARLEREFRPLALDPAAAFRGLLGSIEEQQEKVALAGTGQGESRYARRTLADMRRNLEGGEAVFAAVAPWLLDAGGRAEDLRIRAGFERLRALYASVEGDELPAVPAGWPEDGAQSEYARFADAIERESDPEGEGLMADLLAAAARMDVAVLPRPRVPVAGGAATTSERE